MWLLHTPTGKLKQFPSRRVIPNGGYAILSHRWRDDEKTFQDIQALGAKYDKPREWASNKIREFCILAENLGYQWGWVDSCCIDRTSSSELDESIKSMFDYYSDAGVCIVYLFDVASDCELDNVGSEFRRSSWHERGWTLQELIAPKNLVFYSRDWKRLTTKVDKASLLEEVTGIPQDVLTGARSVTEVSVATRMSWAAHRKTLKEEDEAYCLLGILKVNIFTSYGEGRHAFYRLQEELMKTSTDMSIFAWGDVLDLAHLSNLQDLRLPETIAKRHVHPRDSFLFAPAPSYFRNKSPIDFTPGVLIGSMPGCPFDISSFLTLTPTPNGIRARLPVADLPLQRRLVAFIACTVNGNQLGLVLQPCTNPGATSPDGPVYDISFPNTDRIIRLVNLTKEVPNYPLCFEWRYICIRASPSAHEIQELEQSERKQEEANRAGQDEGKLLGDGKAQARESVFVAWFWSFLVSMMALFWAPMTQSS